MEPILSMLNISKSFPGVKALSHVDFTVRQGEVHCLIGANGAGKSTLMKILTGVYDKDEGDIYFEGSKVEIGNPARSKELGIAIIYQELSLIDHLSVAENIFLGSYLKPAYGLLSWRKLRREAADILERFGISIPVDKRVGELSAGHKQIVELAKAIASHARLIIMDEPSTTLSQKEVETLFRVIGDLKRQGITVIYISHKLEELFAIGDRVTVMRDGRYIATKALTELDEEELVELIIGHKAVRHVHVKHERQFEELLRVEHLTTKHVHNVSFELGKGEIIGLYGLVGSGRTEVLRALYGADKLQRGTIHLHGRQRIIQSPGQAIRAGMGLVPENRKTEGAMLHLSVQENAVISSHHLFSRFSILKGHQVRQAVKERIQALNIKTPHQDTLMVNLSGGNQQKVIISRWLIRDSELLLFDEPTQGIDIGAKEEIYKIMRSLAAEGKGIIVVSSEINELLQVCDRILVMYSGRLVGEFDDPRNEKEEILHYAVKGGEELEAN